MKNLLRTTLRTPTRKLGLALLLGLVAVLYACGGGGEGPPPAPAPAPFPAPAPTPAPIQPAWQGAVLVEQDNAGWANEPQIAIDPHGNGMAVWAQEDANGRTTVWANRYSASTGWGTPTPLEQPATTGFRPKVAVDASGNAMAVWQKPIVANTPSGIVASRFEASTQQWGSATLVASSDTGIAWQPHIAMHASGNAVAVWAQIDDVHGNFHIWANHYSASTLAWGGAVPVETGSLGYAVDPQVALDAAGNAMVVWQQFNHAREEVWANRYSASTGLWGTAQPIDADYGTRHNALAPRIAMDSQGSAAAVWAQHDGTYLRVWGNGYSASTGLWGSATLAEANSAGSATVPAIAISPNGSAIAAWVQHDGTRTHIVTNAYSASSGWGTAQPVHAATTDTVSNPQIAMDGSGNAIAVWQQDDDTRIHMWASHYSPSAAWGNAQRIESRATDGAEKPFFVVAPALAMNAAGIAIAVWEQFDGTNINIWANVFK